MNAFIIIDKKAKKKKPSDLLITFLKLLKLASRHFLNGSEVVLKSNALSGKLFQ